MRTRYVPLNSRKILCVFPRYAPSFGTFHHAYPLLGGRIGAFMPPQGLLVVAAYLPEHWEIRFIDENLAAANDADFRWAHAVLVSGMHVQRPQIEDIIRRAHAHERTVVLGGPSVSGCPEYYAKADILHLGEVGDATDSLIGHLDAHVKRPTAQLRFETVERLPLADFPMPAYDLLPLRQYFVASVQFSSGCPYVCEFCDIPALYGRNPRLKTARQVLAELDEIAATGATQVYFVDDNFIGNAKAALEFLPHLIEWQTRRCYPVRFSCEATLNLAKNDRVLELMRKAGFLTVFCGIETPEPRALRAMAKKQNLQLPVLEAVRRLNAYGLEVVSGIILGLDTDDEGTADRIIEFIEASHIPMLTINVLYALPKTPLWRRLMAEHRFTDDPRRESNIVFKLPYHTVLGMWRKCIAAAYVPSAIYARYAYHQRHTVPHRHPFPVNDARASWPNVAMGLATLVRILWRIGVRGNYRRTFWRMALPALGAGDIERLISVAVMSHHLIQFTRECTRGDGEAAFYAPPTLRAAADEERVRY